MTNLKNYTMKQINDVRNFDVKVGMLVCKILDELQYHCDTYQFYKQFETVKFMYRICDEMSIAQVRYDEISHCTYDDDDHRILVFDKYKVDITIDECMCEYVDNDDYYILCKVVHDDIYGDGGYYCGVFSTKFRFDDTDEMHDKKVDDVVKCIFNECGYDDFIECENDDESEC